MASWRRDRAQQRELGASTPYCAPDRVSSSPAIHFASRRDTRHVLVRQRSAPHHQTIRALHVSIDESVGPRSFTCPPRRGIGSAASLADSIGWKKMTRTRSLVLVGAAVVVSLPAASVCAQGPMMLEAYAAKKQQPVDLSFGGLGFTGYTGIFGLRLSGGMNVGRNDGTEQIANYPYTQCSPAPCQTKVITSNYKSDPGLYVGGWTADADVLVEPFRRVPVMKSLLLGFSPYGFFGVGGYGLRPRGAPDSAVATLNYGAGAHHDLLGWLGVGVEARYRRGLHSDSAVAVGSSRSWEYRLGLTASFGGSRNFRRANVRSDPPRPPVVER